MSDRISNTRPFQIGNSLATSGAIMVAGIIVGAVFFSGAEKEQVVAQRSNNHWYISQITETNYQEERSHVATGRVSQVQQGLKHENSQNILKQYSGLAWKAEQNGLIVVPTSLLESLGARGGHARMDQSFFTGLAAVVEHLQISKTEMENVEESWLVLRSRVRVTEAESVQYEELDDGSLKVVLPNLKSRFSVVADEFRHAVQDSLGSNRAKALLASARVESILSSLGTPKIVTVRPEESGDGSWRFHTVVESGERKRTYVGESLPSAFKHITGDLQVVFQ